MFSEPLEIFFYNPYDTVSVQFKISNICPYCHEKGKQVYLTHTDITHPNIHKNIKMSLVLQCPSCMQHHLAMFVVFETPFGGVIAEPLEPELTLKNLFNYPSQIDKISRQFSEIISQSSKAEQMNLDEIAGIGYRKAIEFLVKDYLKYRIDNGLLTKFLDGSPASKDLIDNRKLEGCIKLIENEDIQNLARYTSWIGNDHTHYIKKLDIDVNEMKTFIDALCYLITLEIKIRVAKSETERLSKS